jgi:prepilin-type N-terminal cleavage/methylation domain-containing protein
MARETSCKTRHPSPHGFTLVELLVVISVIAILMGILMPVLSRARQYAYRVSCLSNLRQIGLVIQIYRDDNRHDFPLARYMPAPFLSMVDDPSIPQVFMTSLGGETKTFKCPGDKTVYDVCETGAQTSYAYNAELAGREPDETWFPLRGIDVPEIPVLRDCDGYTFMLDPPHDSITAPFFHVRRNTLFADIHVDSYSEQEIAQAGDSSR